MNFYIHNAKRNAELSGNIVYLPTKVEISEQDSPTIKSQVEENNKLIKLVSNPDGVPFRTWIGLTILFLPVFPLIWIFLAVIHIGRKNRAAMYYSTMRSIQLHQEILIERDKHNKGI